MPKLITPSKSHEYVVGIDFGHAETSACVCEIEWGKNADEQNDKGEDLILYPNSKEKIITSAISKTNSGDIRIHEDAFKFIDGNNCRIGFKEKPRSLDGEQEQLMIDFMHAVYDIIIKGYDFLTPDNHIVYIARPSGWQEEESKTLYKEMAIKAGIPLAGLTSESRAAIFYAKLCSPHFKSNITKGAIVFDLGSSTLDLTYLSEKYGPYDRGQNLGASIIDDVIFKYMILNQDDNLKQFVIKHPEFNDPLVYEARKFKEKVYSANEHAPSEHTFTVKRILSGIPDSLKNELEAEKINTIKLEVDNANQLDTLVDQKTGYRGRISDFLRDFKAEFIKEDHPINGVLLVGGASSMYYLRELISRSLGIEEEIVRKDRDPNLTVSRGIALLGTKDVITFVLRTEFKKTLKQDISQRVDKTVLKEDLTETVFNLFWASIEKSVKRWANDTQGVDKKKLSEMVVRNLENDFTNDFIELKCKQKLESIVKENCKDLLDKITDAIRYYAATKDVSKEVIPFGEVISNDYGSKILANNNQWLTGIGNFIKNSDFGDWWRHFWGKDDVSRKKMVDNLNSCKYFFKGLIGDSLFDQKALKKVTSEIQASLIKLMEAKIEEVKIPIE